MASPDKPASLTPSARPRGYDDSTPVPPKTGNGWVVATCITMSALLWLAFSLRRPTSVTLKLPTAIVNLPIEESLSAPAPDTVEFVVSGEAIAILPVYYNRPTVEIDAALDEVDFELGGGAAFPADVRVDAASPRRYIPQREARISARVPIDLRLDISIPGTHDYVTRPFVDPDSVVISGAQSVIDGISSWPTQKIVLADVTDSIRLLIPLSDTLAGVVSVTRARTNLVAEVAEFTQGVRDVEVRLTGGPLNRPVATLDPDVIQVSFRVRVEDYQQAMSSLDFYATVPYDRIRGDTTGRVKPILNFPRGIGIRDEISTPPTVRYFNVLYDQ